MKDQVDFLVSRGIKAASLDSTLEPAKVSWVKSEVLSGEMKILYVAPERCVQHAYILSTSDLDASGGHRLNNESFIALMRRVNVSLLAVDESHCISQVPFFCAAHRIDLPVANLSGVPLFVRSILRLLVLRKNMTSSACCALLQRRQNTSPEMYAPRSISIQMKACFGRRFFDRSA
jgi:hypothetical protein